MDTFARDHLPPRELWPEMDLSGVEGLDYPAKLNCAVELLDRMISDGRGDRIALRFAGGSWSYYELLDRANEVSRVLVHDLGLIPGNRVLLRGPNNPLMAACWFGVIKAGGICVATMPLLRAREITYVLNKARVSLALCDARVSADLEQAAPQANALERVVMYNSNRRDDSLEALMATRRGENELVNAATRSDDIALIAFTSGTTGQAKATMHTHRDVLAVCDCFSRHVLKPDSDDIFCGSPPLAFTFGLGGLILFPFRVGASSLVLEQATPPLLLQGIQDHAATICFTAPTAYRVMAGIAGDFNISSLKKCVSAGETLPLATFEAWREATGIEIIDGIGSTEMLHIFISAAGSDIRPGSTGKAVPGYRAKVVDEQGKEVPAGTVGHLAVQGPTGCRYLDDAQRQRAYVKNGWNLPGDSYRMDEDGYFWYQARSDDMIVSAGYKIAGPEVENALLDHPAVLECGVVGVPDAERGHVVKAFVVLRPGHEARSTLVKELQDFVKSEIAPYKYPRQIEFVPALPRTETGKLQRFRLRETTR